MFVNPIFDDNLKNLIFLHPIKNEINQEQYSLMIYDLTSFHYRKHVKSSSLIERKKKIPK